MRGYRLCFLSAGPAGEAIHTRPVIDRKRIGTEKHDAATPNALWGFSFVRSCLSLFASIFLSCLTHIASLHSSPVGLSPPPVKAFGTFHSAGLMSHWIRHFSSKTPPPPFSSSCAHVSTSPHSDRYFSCLFLRSLYNLGEEKTESERVQSRDSELCLLRQAGQYSPSRFLACHSNLLDPLSHGQTPCRMSGFYVFVCSRCFMLQFKAFVLNVPHLIDFKKSCTCCEETVWHKHTVASALFLTRGVTSSRWHVHDIMGVSPPSCHFLSNMLACVMGGHVDVPQNKNGTLQESFFCWFW